MSKAPVDPLPVRPDHTKVQNPGPSKRDTVGSWLLTLFVTGAILGLLLALTLSTMGRTTDGVNQVMCARNLRQIGMACIHYANTNGGRFPDSVGTLFANSDLRGEWFACPSSDATPAAGPTTQATANLLQNSPPPGSRGHCLSYVYVGGSLTSQSPPASVVAYDLPGNHVDKGGKSRGGQVVYADGHAEWHGAAELNAIIAAVQAGQNPPPPAATRPTIPPRP